MQLFISLITGWVRTFCWQWLSQLGHFYKKLEKFFRFEWGRNIYVVYWNREGARTTDRNTFLNVPWHCGSWFCFICIEYIIKKVDDGNIHWFTFYFAEISLWTSDSSSFTEFSRQLKWITVMKCTESELPNPHSHVIYVLQHVSVSTIYLIPGNNQLLLSANIWFLLFLSFQFPMKLCHAVPCYKMVHIMSVLKSRSALNFRKCSALPENSSCAAVFHSSHFLSALQPFPIVILQQKVE